MAYTPNQDYDTAWGAVQRRIASQFAQRRGGTQADLAARGVQTSGVSSIPLENINREESLATSDQAGKFALDQANNQIQDRRLEADRALQMQMAREGWDRQDSLARRQSRDALTGAIISGTLSGAGAAMKASDRRLKDDIVAIGEKAGLPWYSFTYKPGYGLPAGRQEGFMADEVEKVRPDAVVTVDGFKMVNYGLLGVA